MGINNSLSMIYKRRRPSALLYHCSLFAMMRGWVGGIAGGRELEAVAPVATPRELQVT